MIGRLISHYRLIDTLGQGGMGVVYRAEDIVLGRQVAIKFLHTGPGITDEDRERFVNEARAAAALNHPNVATVHEVAEDDDATFIVMELVEGESLKDVIASERPDFESAIGLAIQIAEGLNAAHAKSIIHRDIKSANIMVLPDGRVKILDFGLARIGGGTMMTSLGLSMGTAAYMSPEQARGEHVDHRTDIWAFGVVLYEMLTGSMPFPGAYEQSVMYAIFNEPPRPLVGIDADEAGVMWPIIEKLLQKVPDDRYSSVADVVQDLRDVQKGSAPERATPAPEPAVDMPSIAVLPFVDMSREQDQEYFCDGITEELIDALAQVDAWRIVSRTSTFAFKGSEADVRQVGDRLRATHVLEGSLRKSGNRVRVTTRLTGVKDGFQIWSEKYDGDLEDIFDIQDNIATAVLEKLKVSLVGDEVTLVRKSTDDMGAYNLYLKARHEMSARSVEALEKAIDLSEQAVTIDAKFAPAYAAMADSLLLLAVQGARDPLEAMPMAREKARKAIELDDTLSEAHTSLAAVTSAFDRDLRSAEASFLKAIELNPSSAGAHHWYALWCLLPLRRMEEAIAEMRTAQQLDPLSPVRSAAVGWALYLARQYEEAERQLRDTLRMEESFIMARDLLGQTLLQVGRIEDAVVQLERSVADSNRRSLSLSLLIYALAKADQVGSARAALIDLESRSGTGYASLYDVALAHCGLDNQEEALHYLELALDAADPWLQLIGVEPMWDPLRSENKFADVVDRAGLPS